MTQASTVLPSGFHRPEPDDLDMLYWDGLTRERLLLQRCERCHEFQWLPEIICHRCLSRDLTYTEVEARGTLFSWTRVWHPVNSALVESCPYLIGVVQIEGASEVRLIGNLVDVPDGTDPPIGAAVSGVFEHHDSYSLLQWRLVADGQS